MADKIVKITFEIDGLEQSVTNIDDAKVALQQLETQAKKAGDAADTAADDFDKLGTESKNAGEAGEGAISVLDEATGGLASRFKNVIGGIGKMGTALKTSFKAGIKGATGLKTALVATGIGALVVALGLIVQYWDDIVGLVSGVTSEQKKLNAEVEANVTTQQEALDAISAQENSLKLQGKSEAEIRDLKIEQTNEVIAATILQLEQMQKTKEAQVAAAQRNKDIAQGVIRFLTLPITILLGTVDQLTKAISLIPGVDIGTNLEEGFSGGIAGMIFDPEEVAAEGDATIKETEAQLTKLKNTRDGFKLASNKADADDAAKRKAALDKETEDRIAAEQKVAAEKKAIADKAAADKIIADQLALDNRAIVDGILQQANLDEMEDYFVRAQAELAIDKAAQIQKLIDADATEAEILRIKQHYQGKSDQLGKEKVAFDKTLEKEKVGAALDASAQVLDSIVNLVGEGSAVGKAAAIASTTISTYQSATAAYASMVGVPFVGPVLAPIAAGVAVASGLMSIKKIVSTKTPGNKSAGSVPSISVPNAPAVNPETALQAGADADQDANTQVTVSSQQEADAKINDLARL